MDYPLCCPGWGANCVYSWDGCDDTNKLPKMAANKRIQKTSKPVEGCFGTECDDGRCCNNRDYPLCCPGWSDNCVVSWDGCDDTNKLPKMAANKRIQKSSKQLGDGCDGADCGNGWCCNDSDYSVCCPIGDDGIQWCANDADDCPSTKRF